MEKNEMKMPNNIEMLLLGIWLTLTELIELPRFSFSGLPIFIAILAIATGVFVLLVGERFVFTPDRFCKRRELVSVVTEASVRKC
jgi:hypothetical protein